VLVTLNIAQTNPILQSYAFFYLLRVSAKHIDHHQVEKFSHERKSATEEAFCHKYVTKIKKNLVQSLCVAFVWAVLVVRKDIIS
jgi:hypothetical protein